MTASTKNTIWTVALVAVFLFLVWKLWPAINAALRGGGGGGGGAVGGATGYDEGDYGQPYYQQPQQNPLQALLSGLGLGGSNSGAGGASSAAASLTPGAYPWEVWPSDAESALTDWTQIVISQGDDNAALLSGNLGDSLSGEFLPPDNQTPQSFGSGNDAGWSEGFDPSYFNDSGDGGDGGDSGDSGDGGDGGDGGGD